MESIAASVRGEFGHASFVIEQMTSLVATDRPDCAGLQNHAKLSVICNGVYHRGPIVKDNRQLGYGFGDSMWRLECVCNANLPRLAWCAILEERDNRVVVHHGPWIEVGESAFVEGAWSGSYTEMGFSQALTFTGSGAALTPDGVLFATQTYIAEPLYVLRADRQLYFSNTLCHLLENAGDEIDPGYMFYDVDPISLAPRAKSSASRIPTRNQNCVTVHYYCNLAVTDDLKLTILPKRQRGAFRDYSDYLAFLNEQVFLTAGNGADPRRSIRYTPLATISSGYDSPAVSIIAKNAGCRESVTFSTASDETNDSGKHIGQLLGLDVTEYDPEAYRSRNDLPEAEFAATSGGGGHVIYTACEERLGAKMLLTGHYGDAAWERADGKGGFDTANWDSDGDDMIYFRARVGFLCLPVPSIAYSEFKSIDKITNSDEMRPWRMQRNYYDRPIPRRILEEAGVSSEMFGQKKKYATRALRFRHPDVIDEPNLRKVMAPKSYEHFSRWAQDFSLYSSVVDRWVFALMHKLYWLNMRLIRSKKVSILATRLHIPLPKRPWIPIRYRKQRVLHRLLLHWGMEQIKPRYSIGHAGQIKDFLRSD